MKKQIKRVVFIGSGNVSTRLALTLQYFGIEIVQVYGRTLERAQKLSSELNVEYTTDISNIIRDADLYIMSIADDALMEIASKLDFDKQFVVHTSGTTCMSILNKFDNYGVFYPLQTFSKDKTIDFERIPFCLEANTEENLEMLKDLASLITKSVHSINSEQRKVLHIGAVFANNFSNFMYAVAEDLLEQNDLSFELLKPLIDETANKLNYQNPFEAQTGPARRNDNEIINKHLTLLKDQADYQHIYKFLSEQIKRKHHK